LEFLEVVPRDARMAVSYRGDGVSFLVYIVGGGEGDSNSFTTLMAHAVPHQIRMQFAQKGLVTSTKHAFLGFVGDGVF